MESLNFDGKNEALTVQARNNPKYEVFLKWMVDNGTIIEKRIQYPTAFGPRGYIGVSTQDAIKSYQPVIAIPKKLIIDISKVMQTKQLKQILIDNPLLFRQKDQQQNNFNMISLFLIYEKSKGERSFWKPYFDAAQCDDLIINWSQNQLKQIQNLKLIQQLRKYKVDIGKQSQSYLKIIESNSDVFPKQIPREQYEYYLNWSYEFIITRVFGWTIPGSNLIPFADMLNHGYQALDHCLAHVQYSNNNKDTDKHNNVTSKSRVEDTSQFKNKVLTCKESKSSQYKNTKAYKRLKYVNSKKQFIQDQIFNQVQIKQIVHQIAYKKYKTDNKKFRQLYFGSSSCTEDNDTDNSDLMTRQYNKQIIKISDKQILKGKNTTRSLSNSLQDYWTIYAEKQTMPFLTVNNNQKTILSDNSIKYSNEYQSESDGEQESQQSDEQGKLEWMTDNPTKDAYFVMYTTKEYKPGDQIYNFYGKRSNKFLVLGYNFALKNNKYDSYGFRLYFDNPSMSVPFNFKIIDHLSPFTSTVFMSSEIRLKKSRVSVDLISHCRALILSTFTNLDNIYGIPVTIPTNKIIEQQAIQLAKQIVQYKINQFTTMIDEDYQILNNSSLTYKMQIAVTVRLSYKIILKTQLSYLDQCLLILRQFKNGRINLDFKDMNNIEKIKDYICVLDRSLF